MLFYVANLKEVGDLLSRDRRDEGFSQEPAHEDDVHELRARAS